MKKVFTFLALCLLSGFFSHGQCVIYACDNTGAFGAGFNNDGKPTSMQECEDYALKLCKQEGGTNCTFLYKSTKAGWWAMIKGKKADGRNFFQGSDGNSSKSEAENAVRNKYRQDGGVNADNIKVTTWFVYSNLK